MTRPPETFGVPGSLGGPFARSVINVKDHGAKGDGRTDDTKALKDIIRASESGDAVYFPPGRYLISATLEPKVNQLYFSLTDRAMIQARRDRPGFSVFAVSLGPVEFRHLTIEASNVAPASSAEIVSGISREPDATGVVDVVVHACHVLGAHDDGIHIVRRRDAVRGSGRVIVRDTSVSSCGLNGLTLGHVDNVRVESSRFERCNNGINVHDCQDVLVRAVTAHANRRHGIAFTFSHRWHVTECVARENGSAGDGGKDHGWGIAAGGEASKGLIPNSDFTVTNSICEDNVRGGITLDPTMETTKIEPQRARVSGNLCRGGQGSHGIQVTHGSDVVVTDNVCSGNAKGSGIQIVSSSHVLVQGNACFGNLNGIRTFDGQVPGAGDYVIGVNITHDNASDPLVQTT